MDAYHELTAAYALDALDPQDRVEFEDHLAECDECRAEVASFSTVTDALAHAAEGPVPPAALRGRILEQARSPRAGRERANVLPFRPRLRLAPALAAVAAVAALGLGLWGLSVSRELDDVRSARSDEAAAIAILSDPGARRVPFSGTEGNLIVSAAGDAAVVLHDVQPAPDGKTYELWVVEAGVARRAGLFTGAGRRVVVALERPVRENAAVAVTIEDEGGAEAPTGPPLFQTPAV